MCGVVEADGVDEVGGKGAGDDVLLVFIFVWRKADHYIYRIRTNYGP